MDKGKIVPYAELTADEKQVHNIALAKLMSSFCKAILEFTEAYEFLSYCHQLKEKEDAKNGTDKGE